MAVHTSVDDKWWPKPMNKGVIFEWAVRFKNPPPGVWIIQHIKKSRAVHACEPGKQAEVDAEIDRQRKGKGWVITPEYWEAWWVDSSGKVRLPKPPLPVAGSPPQNTADPSGFGHDIWMMPCGVPESWGLWHIEGELHLASSLPAGFAFNAVSDAHELPAKAGSAPGGIGAGFEARRRGGFWSFCPSGPHTHDKA